MLLIIIKIYSISPELVSHQLPAPSFPNARINAKEEVSCLRLGSHVLFWDSWKPTAISFASIGFDCVLFAESLMQTDINGRLTVRVLTSSFELLVYERCQSHTASISN